MKKQIFFLILLSLLFCGCSSNSVDNQQKEKWNTNYTYVFVHGLSGWGHYDFQNIFLPYWGMKNGSLMKYLSKQGFDVHDASVAPQGSAWDRACELYAQLTGTRTDYGLEHSVRCRHERFGKDFSNNPLIKKWDEENKINLLGHSFGGVTVRLLAHLMEYGAESEINSTPEEELSPLFAGGHKGWIYSITTLSSPHNGTSAYHIKDPEPQTKTTAQKLMDKINNRKKDNRADSDVAAFDMHIENARKINGMIKTLENTYYFSFPTNATILKEDGTYAPDPEKMESLFKRTSELIGSFEGITYDGIELTKEWQMNDGLVNTVSSKAPEYAPSRQFDPKEISRGIWNIMPVYKGDHMSLQGGFQLKNDVSEFYKTHLNLINTL